MGGVTVAADSKAKPPTTCSMPGRRRRATTHAFRRSLQRRSCAPHLGQWREGSNGGLGVRDLRKRRGKKSKPLEPMATIRVSLFKARLAPSPCHKGHGLHTRRAAVVRAHTPRRVRPAPHQDARQKDLRPLPGVHTGGTCNQGATQPHQNAQAASHDEHHGQRPLHATARDSGARQRGPTAQRRAHMHARRPTRGCRWPAAARTYEPMHAACDHT
jgi:hypothetical protein